MTRTALALTALLLASFVGCSKTPEPQAQEKAAPPPAPVPSAVASAAPASAAPSANAAPEGGEITYEVPKAWEVVPGAKPMRKATYRVPKQAGDPEDAELAVSDAGGSKDANISRWAKQFGKDEPSKKEDRTVNGLTVTVVEVKGEYAGMGGAKKDNFMLLGAMVPAGGPSQFHFFKMTGPEKTVTAAKKDFDAFVASFRAK